MGPPGEMGPQGTPGITPFSAQSAKKISTLYVRSAGRDYPGDRTQHVILDGVEYGLNARGLTLVVINRADHQVTLNKTYDTYGDTNASAALQLALTALDTTSIVVLAASDSFDGSFTVGLGQAMQRCGAGDIVYKPGFRSSYLLVGICNNGPRTGVERFMTPSSAGIADLETLIIDGRVVGMGHAFNAVQAPMNQNLVRVGDVMIQWGTYTINTSGQTNFYPGSVTFPVPFTQPPSVSFLVGDVGPWAAEPTITSCGVSATAACLQLTSHTFGTSSPTAMDNANTSVSWIAIGR